MFHLNLLLQPSELLEAVFGLGRVGPELSSSSEYRSNSFSIRTLLPAAFVPVQELITGSERV